MNFLAIFAQNRSEETCFVCLYIQVYNCIQDILDVFKATTGRKKERFRLGVQID